MAGQRLRRRLGQGHVSSPDAVVAQMEEIARHLSPEQVTFLIGRLAQAQSALDPMAAADAAVTLRVRFEALEQHSSFRRGQLVRWKPGLRNKQLPAYGDSAIVLEVLDAPLVNVADPPDSPFFRERLDLALGVLDAAGDFVCFHFDGRRFETTE